MSWLVVRVRSNVGVERSIRETMHHLNLTKVNHAVIVPEKPELEGMLRKAKDYITWGEVSSDFISNLIKERGRLVGDHPVTDNDVSNSTGFKNIEDFANAIASGNAEMKDMSNLKRVFRLHPPRGTKGWGGIKRSFRVGGALGPRGSEIENLVERML